MEKRNAHYKLEDIKNIVADRQANAFTRTALHGIDDLSLTLEEAIAVVLSLTKADFYKSMTTHADHRVWQDVYHGECPNGKTAYIKLTKTDGAVVISFKEK